MRKITAANDDDVDDESLLLRSPSLPTTDVSNDRASMALEKWDGPFDEGLLPLFQTMAGAADTDAATAARSSSMDFIMVNSRWARCLRGKGEDGLEEREMVTLYSTFVVKI